MAIVPSAAVLSFLMFCRIFIPNFVTSCGLQILFYPTAIGSEPQDPSLNSYPHWTRVMTGHAGANLVCCPYLKLTGICGSLIWLFVHDLSCMQVPLVASNRLGTETFTDSEITFYGGSFIADHKGGIVRQVRICNPILTFMSRANPWLLSNLKGQYQRADWQKD